jgi:hypothetical protein
MDPATLFLLGAWLVPLALVSGISAWADSRKPWVAGGLALAAAGLIGWANAKGGPFGPRDIPDLTLAIIVHLRAALF